MFCCFLKIAVKLGALRTAGFGDFLLGVCDFAGWFLFFIPSTSFPGSASLEKLQPRNNVGASFIQTVLKHN